MIEERRCAYLRAMGLDVWRLRPDGAEPGCVGIGGGRDSTLLLSAFADDREGELAGDLARALGGDPVWAWLDPAVDEQAQILQEVVAERLITRILVFGADTGRRAFAGAIPDVLGSATVIVLPSLQELAASGAARQALWGQVRLPHTAPQEGS